jgi:integrase
MTYFSKEQVKQLAFNAIDIFDNKALADAIIFSAYTGVRQGELLKLKSEDFDPALNQIWIGGKPGRSTKPNDVRNIVLHPLVEPIVKDRLDQNYLFRDDWTNKDQLYSAFKKVRKYCGIDEDHVWHSLRHSFGTFLGEQTHPRQIMALMGHKQISTSLRYVKATDSATRTAILAI